MGALSRVNGDYKPTYNWRVPPCRSCSALTIPWNDMGMQVRAWPLGDDWWDTVCICRDFLDSVQLWRGKHGKWDHGEKAWGEAAKEMGHFYPAKNGRSTHGNIHIHQQISGLAGNAIFFCWPMDTPNFRWDLPTASGQWPTAGCDRMWSPTTHWWAAVNVPAFGRQCLGSCGVTEPIYQHLTSKLLERTSFRFRLVEIPFLIPMTDPWCWYIYANIKGVYWWDPCYHI